MCGIRIRRDRCRCLMILVWGERMYVFTCKDQYEDKLCCIFAAWEKALTVGHDQIRLCVEPVKQYTLFEEYTHVAYQEEQYQRVRTAIRTKLSEHILFQIHYASLSYEDDALWTIYRFLVKGFRLGRSCMKQYEDPDVMRFVALLRSVSNEAHHFREFARFTSINDQVYVCHLEPKSNVIEIVGNHFADRMPSEHFMIIDDNRGTAVVHPKDGQNYLRILTEEEREVLSKTEQQEDQFTTLWKTFVKAIAISQRANYNCQRNLMPLWTRKHMTEFI